jgi:hypothetical protein
MWPTEDGVLVLNGVTSTVKDRGYSLVKECLSLSGIRTMSCLCYDGDDYCGAECRRRIGS